MAKILFCLNSVVDFNDHAIDSFYEGFISALVHNGNDVYLFRTNNFLTYSTVEQKLWPSIDKKRLDSYIKSIEPDLILTFNNSLYREVLQETECPVVFYASESLDFLQSIELMKKYESRYHYMCFSEDSRKQMVDNLPIDKNRSFLTYVSTDLKNEAMEYERNITFVGCVHYLPTQTGILYQNFIESPERRELLLSVLNALEQRPLSLDEPHLEELQRIIADPNVRVTLMNLLSRSLRLETLSAVSDLGLEVYGKDFLSVFPYFPKVALACQGVAISSQLSQIYNSSKISLNIPHIHSKSSFTWRVPEIMASNSVLISRSGLERVFGDKFKLPSFKNPYEARELCSKLLMEENFRQDLIAYSNEIVDKLCRFRSRLEELEELTSVKLFNAHSPGKIFYIDIKNYSKSFWQLFEKLLLPIVNKLPDRLILNLGHMAAPIKHWIPQSIKKVYKNLDKRG